MKNKDRTYLHELNRELEPMFRKNGEACPNCVGTYGEGPFCNMSIWWGKHTVEVSMTGWCINYKPNAYKIGYDQGYSDAIKFIAEGE
jgi:hypothetical protein